MLEDIIPSIFDVIIESKKKLTNEDISNLSGFEMVDVKRSLNVLLDMGLVVKKQNGDGVVYELIKNPKGIHLAKAAQLGINLHSFSHYFDISDKEKELALNVATQAEKIKSLEISKRKPLFQKRAYLSFKHVDDASDNLMLLMEASSASLYEYVEELAKDNLELKMLLDLHSQAEQALHEYYRGVK